MSVKRKIADFICAFIAFCIIFLSITLLTTESFFEGTVMWNAQEASLSAFGTEFDFDKRIPDIMRRLFSFNDVVFGKAFLNVLTHATGFFAEYVADGLSFAYHVARMAVGAE